jgi:hypothetical protein
VRFRLWRIVVIDALWLNFAVPFDDLEGYKPLHPELASASDVKAVEGSRELDVLVKLLHKRRKTAFWGSLLVGGGYRSRTDDLPARRDALALPSAF